MSKEPLWGEPPKRVRGAYQNSPESPRWRFGPHDAGDAFEFGMMVQPVIIPVSMAIEQMATRIDPTMSGTAAFGTAWLMQFLAALLLRVLVNLLRHHGASIIRDFGVWLWYQLSGGFMGSLKDSLFGWLPGFKRRRRREDDKPVPDRPDAPDEPRRRPLIDWLFPRRKR